MSDNSEKNVQILDGGSTFDAHNTTAATVGELRTSDGRNWTGTVSVSGREADDNTPIRSGDYIAHVTGNKTGG